MFRIRKEYRFEASHLLVTGRSEDGECSGTIVGRSYVVEVFLTAQGLNAAGRVAGAKELEAVAGIVAEWDHALIVSAEASETCQEALGEFSEKLVVVDFLPTPENMALDLHDRIPAVLDTLLEQGEENRLHLEKVRVHEDTTGWAEYEERDERHPPFSPEDDAEAERFEAELRSLLKSLEDRRKKNGTAGLSDDEDDGGEGAGDDE